MTTTVDVTTPSTSTNDVFVDELPSGSSSISATPTDVTLGGSGHYYSIHLTFAMLHRLHWSLSFEFHLDLIPS